MTSGPGPRAAYSAVCFVEIIDISIYISTSIGMGAMAIRCLRFLRSLLFLFLFFPLFPLFLSRGKVAASRKLENFCSWAKVNIRRRDIELELTTAHHLGGPPALCG